MVKVTIGGKTDGNRRVLIMEGHADYSPGNDIVCAACSAIVYSFLGWLINNSEHIHKIHVVEDGPGQFEADAEGDDYFHVAFDMTQIGLMQLAYNYPDNVCVTIVAS